MQNQYNNALADLARLPQMIDYFSQVFGPYPFEKYGNAVVSMSTYGAMEHQTMTTLGNYIITCLLYTSPSPRDRTRSRMPSSAWKKKQTKKKQKKKKKHKEKKKNTAPQERTWRVITNT